MSGPKTKIDDGQTSQAYLTPEELDILAGRGESAYEDVIPEGVIGDTMYSGDSRLRGNDKASEDEPSFDEALDYFANPQTLTDKERQDRLKSSVTRLFTPPPADPKKDALDFADRAREEARDLKALADSLELDFDPADITDRLDELQAELYAEGISKEDITAVNEEIGLYYALCASLKAALTEYGRLRPFATIPFAGEYALDARGNLQVALTLLSGSAIDPNEGVLTALVEAGESAAKAIAVMEVIKAAPAAAVDAVFTDERLAPLKEVKGALTRAGVGLALVEEFYESDDIPQEAKARPDLLIDRLARAGVLDTATLKEAGLSDVPAKLRDIAEKIGSGETTLEDGIADVKGVLLQAAFDRSKDVRDGIAAGIESAFMGAFDPDAGKEETREKFLKAKGDEAIMTHVMTNDDMYGVDTRPAVTAEDEARWNAEFEKMWSEARAEQEREWKAAIRTTLFDIKGGLGREINDIEGTTSFRELIAKQEKVSGLLGGKGRKYSLDTLFEITKCAKVYASGAQMAKGLNEALGMHTLAGIADSYFTKDSFIERSGLRDDSTLADATRARRRFEGQIDGVERSMEAANFYNGVAIFGTTVGIIMAASAAGALAAQAAAELGLVAEGGIGAFFIDATVFGIADTALSGAAFDAYPKTFGEFAEKMVHTYVAFGALRGMGSILNAVRGGAELGTEIINSGRALENLSVKEERAVAMALGGNRGVIDALVTDAMQILGSHIALTASSGVLGVVGIGEMPQGVGTWEDILTLTILHFRGKMQGGRERIFARGRVEYKKPAALPDPAAVVKTGKTAETGAAASARDKLFEPKEFVLLVSGVIEQLGKLDAKWRNPYHNSAHARDVYDRATRYAKLMGLGKEDTQALQFAALYHDYDHNGKTIRGDETGLSNEEAAASAADRHAQELGFSPRQRKLVRELIIATTVGDPGIAPSAMMEQLLAAADIAGFSRPFGEWVNEGFGFIRELPGSARPKDVEGWVNFELGFLDKFVRPRIEALPEAVREELLPLLDEARANVQLALEKDSANRKLVEKELKVLEIEGEKQSAVAAPRDPENWFEDIKDNGHVMVDPEDVFRQERTTPGTPGETKRAANGEVPIRDGHYILPNYKGDKPIDMRLPDGAEFEHPMLNRTGGELRIIFIVPAGVSKESFLAGPSNRERPNNGLKAVSPEEMAVIEIKNPAELVTRGFYDRVEVRFANGEVVEYDNFGVIVPSVRPELVEGREEARDAEPAAQAAGDGIVYLDGALFGVDPRPALKQGWKWLMGLGREKDGGADALDVYTFKEGGRTTIQRSSDAPWLYYSDGVIFRELKGGRVAVEAMNDPVELCVNGRPVPSGAAVKSGDVVTWRIEGETGGVEFGKRTLFKKNFASVSPNETQDRNVRRIYSKGFIDTLRKESVGGNAGDIKAAANGVFDPETGEILAFGNIQAIPENLKRHPRVSLIVETRSAVIVDVVVNGECSKTARENLMRLKGLNKVVPMEWYLSGGATLLQFDASAGRSVYLARDGVNGYKWTATRDGAVTGEFKFRTKAPRWNIPGEKGETEAEAAAFRERADAFFKEQGLDPAIAAGELFGECRKDAGNLAALDAFIRIFGEGRFYEEAGRAFPDVRERDRFIKGIANYADIDWLSKNGRDSPAVRRYGRLIAGVADVFRQNDHPFIVKAGKVVDGIVEGIRVFFGAIAAAPVAARYKAEEALAKANANYYVIEGAFPGKKGTIAVTPGYDVYSVQLRTNYDPDYAEGWRVAAKILVKYGGRLHELDKETYYREVDGLTDNIKARYKAKKEYESLMFYQGIPPVEAVMWNGKMVVLDGNHRFTAAGQGYPLLMEYSETNTSSEGMRKYDSAEPYSMGRGAKEAENYDALLQQQLNVQGILEYPPTSGLYKEMLERYKQGDEGRYAEAIDGLKDIRRRADALEQNEVTALLKEELNKRIEFLERRSKGPPPKIEENIKPTEEDIEAHEKAVAKRKAEESFNRLVRAADDVIMLESELAASSEADRAGIMAKKRAAEKEFSDSFNRVRDDSRKEVVRFLNNALVGIKKGTHSTPGVEIGRTASLTLSNGTVFKLPSNGGVWKADIGRGNDADIQVADTQASRSHAKIMGFGTRGYSVIDAGSKNGTFVNGRRVGNSVEDIVELKDGDRIRIGTTEFTFHIERNYGKAVLDPSFEKGLSEARGLSEFLDVVRRYGGTIYDVEGRAYSPEDAAHIIEDIAMGRFKGDIPNFGVLGEQAARILSKIEGVVSHDIVPEIGGYAVDHRMTSNPLADAARNYANSFSALRRLFEAYVPEGVTLEEGLEMLQRTALAVRSAPRDDGGTGLIRALEHSPIKDVLEANGVIQAVRRSLAKRQNRLRGMRDILGIDDKVGFIIENEIDRLRQGLKGGDNARKEKGTLKDGTRLGEHQALEEAIKLQERIDKAGTYEELLAALDESPLSSFGSYNYEGAKANIERAARFGEGLEWVTDLMGLKEKAGRLHRKFGHSAPVLQLADNAPPERVLSEIDAYTGEKGELKKYVFSLFKNGNAEALKERYKTPERLWAVIKDVLEGRRLFEEWVPREGGLRDLVERVMNKKVSAAVELMNARGEKIPEDYSPFDGRYINGSLANRYVFVVQYLRHIEGKRFEIPVSEETMKQAVSIAKKYLGVDTAEYPEARDVLAKGLFSPEGLADHPFWREAGTAERTAAVEALFNNGVRVNMTEAQAMAVIERYGRAGLYREMQFAYEEGANGEPAGVLFLGDLYMTMGSKDSYSAGHNHPWRPVRTKGNGERDVSGTIFQGGRSSGSGASLDGLVYDNGVGSIFPSGDYLRWGKRGDFFAVTSSAKGYVEKGLTKRWPPNRYYHDGYFWHEVVHHNGRSLIRYKPAANGEMAEMKIFWAVDPNVENIDRGELVDVERRLSDCAQAAGIALEIKEVRYTDITRLKQGGGGGGKGKV